MVFVLQIFFLNLKSYLSQTFEWCVY